MSKLVELLKTNARTGLSGAGEAAAAEVYNYITETLKTADARIMVAVRHLVRATENEEALEDDLGGARMNVSEMRAAHETTKLAYKTLRESTERFKTENAELKAKLASLEGRAAIEQPEATLVATLENEMLCGKLLGWRRLSAADGGTVWNAQDGSRLETPTFLTGADAARLIQAMSNAALYPRIRQMDDGHWSCSLTNGVLSNGPTMWEAIRSAAITHTSIK